MRLLYYFWNNLSRISSFFKIVWNKYLLINNFDIVKSFSARQPLYFSLRVSFMRVKDLANLHIFTVNLFIPYQMRQYIILKVQCSYLWRSTCHLVLLSTKDKRIAITVPENQKLNIGNQYQKDATYIVCPWNQREVRRIT